MNSKDKSSNIMIANPSIYSYSPETYTTLIKKHKNLPREYFKVTRIKYDPFEICVNTHNETPSSDVNEGLIKTYPTKKTLSFVCDRLNKNQFPIKSDDFIIQSPNDDGSIYGSIVIAIHIVNLSSEFDSLLINSFQTCGYHLGATFNRVDDDGMPCVVYQFDQYFKQIYIKNMLIVRCDDLLHR